MDHYVFAETTSIQLTRSQSQTTTQFLRWRICLPHLLGARNSRNWTRHRHTNIGSRRRFLEAHNYKHTHKELYHYDGLPFGVSSTIFQRTMEGLHQGIPHFVVRIGDVLVSGKGGPDLLANLGKVLSKHSSARLRLRLDKCLFMQSTVTYCGFVITGDGIQPMVAKVEAMKNAQSQRSLVN